MKKQVFLKEAKTLFLMIIFSMVYSLGLIWFLESVDPPIFSVGVPGLAQIVMGMFDQWFQIPLANYYLGIFILIGNIPTLLIGYFGVSKKFTIYSGLSVLIQMLIAGFMPRNNFGLTDGLDPFAIAIIGGLIIGVGIGGALRIGVSLGGIDIVSQYVSLKKGISVGFIYLIINIIILVMGAVVYKDLSLIATTGIAIIVTTLITDKIHTSYQFLKVEIVTNNYEQLLNNILHDLGRGGTLVNVKGGYNKTEKKMIVVAISTYELPALKTIIEKYDSGAFVLVQPVRHIYGNFAKKTIV